MGKIAKSLIIKDFHCLALTLLRVAINNYNVFYKAKYQAKVATGHVNTNVTS